MGKFCTRCGSLNDESTGLCPVCDREQLEAMKAPQHQVNFCTVCGTPLDPMTGACPHCSKPAEVPLAVEEPAVEEAAVEVTPVEEPAAEEVIADEIPVEEPAIEEPVPVAEAGNEAPVAAVAVQEAPAPMPAVEAPTVAVEYQKKRSGAAKVILTIFLSLLLFITTLLSVVVICVRHTTSEGTVLSILEEVDYSKVFNSLYTEEYGDSDGGAGTFTEELSNYFEDNFGVTVSDKQIQGFIEDSTVMEFLAEKASAFVSDLYNGTDEFKITKKEVTTLLRENADVIEEHFDVQISDHSVQELSDWMVDDEVLEKISPSALKNENEAVFYSLNIGFSYFTMAILLALVLLCLVGMGFNDLSKGAMGAGIVFIIIGALFTAFALVLAGLPGILNAIIGQNLISTMAMKFLLSNLVIFVSILLLGVLILVARYVVRRIVAKRRQRKAV